MTKWDERSACVMLNLVPSVGPIRFRRLMERFGSAAAVLEGSVSDLAEVEGFGISLAEKLARSFESAPAQLETEMSLCEKHGISFITATDEDYPESLRHIADPPIVLYVKGQIRHTDALAVAVVGTRRPTAYGSAAAERLSRELAEAGVTVISGLARGVDTLAHTAALKASGRTIGVLGSGLGRFYPPENKGLAEKMALQGAVLTEFPVSTEPDRGNFPRRNRLISALSLAVLVVEADETSGALITARLAAEQGKDVFAVPGSIFSKMSAGPHRLLKQGAKLVEQAGDVLEEIESLKALIKMKKQMAPEKNRIELNGQENDLLEHVSLEPMTIDDLSGRTGLPSPVLSALLLNLELKGFVKSLPGKNYVRTESVSGARERG